MSELTINTTQNVKINFTAASVGERIGAYFIDLIIKIAYLLVVGFVFFYLFNLDKIMNNMDNWSRVSIMMLIFLPFAFYSITLESIFEGQTLGKKLIKIKVVKIDGYQASFGDYLIRWLFRIIDINSCSGIIGLIAMIVSEKSQRLGDMSSGTAVISLKNNITINSTIIEDIGNEYVPTYPLVIKLSDNDARIIKETFNASLAKDDYEMINKLKDKIELVTGIKNQSGNNRDFIRTILKDYNYYTQNM